MRPTVGRLPAQIIANCARLPGSNSERSRKPRGGWQQCSSTLAQHRAPQTDYVCGICSPFAPHSDCAPVFSPTRPTFHWQMQQRHDQWQCHHCRVSLLVPCISCTAALGSRGHMAGSSPFRTTSGGLSGMKTTASVTRRVLLFLSRKTTST